MRQLVSLIISYSSRIEWFLRNQISFFFFVTTTILDHVILFITLAHWYLPKRKCDNLDYLDYYEDVEPKSLTLERSVLIHAVVASPGVHNIVLVDAQDCCENFSREFNLLRDFSHPLGEPCLAKFLFILLSFEAEVSHK